MEDAREILNIIGLNRRNDLNARFLTRSQLQQMNINIGDVPIRNFREHLLSFDENLRHELHVARRYQVMDRCITGSIALGLIVGSLYKIFGRVSFTDAFAFGILSTIFCFGISICCTMACDCGEISFFDNDIAIFDNI